MPTGPVKLLFLLKGVGGVGACSAELVLASGGERGRVGSRKPQLLLADWYTTTFQSSMGRSVKKRVKKKQRLS